MDDSQLCSTILLVCCLFGCLTNCISIRVLVGQKLFRAKATLYQLNISVYVFLTLGMMVSAQVLSLTKLHLSISSLISSFCENILMCGVACNMLIQGYERYYGLCRPLKSRTKSNKQTTKCNILLSWVVSIPASALAAMCQQHIFPLSNEIDGSLVTVQNNASTATFHNLTNLTTDVSVSANNLTGLMLNGPKSWIFCEYHKHFFLLRFSFLFFVPLAINVAMFLGIVRRLRMKVPGEPTRTSSHRTKQASKNFSRQYDQQNNDNISSTRSAKGRHRVSQKVNSMNRSVNNKCFLALFPYATYEQTVDVESVRKITQKRHPPSPKSANRPTWLWRIRMKAVKNLGLQIVTFVLQWLPVHVLGLKGATDTGSYRTLEENNPNSLRFIGTVLICCACILIPILQCLYSTKFRKAYWKSTFRTPITTSENRSIVRV